MSKYITEENIKWISSIIITGVITIIGWISVYKLNQKNMKRDKKIATYLNTFDYLKDSINEVVQAYSGLSSYLFMTYQRIDNLLPNILYEINKKTIVQDLEEDLFKDKINKASGAFLKFIYSWEQYEIVLLSLVKQRHALQDEHRELSEIFSKAQLEYKLTLIHLKHDSNIQDEKRIKLVLCLREAYEQALDFTACIRDININLQNFIFFDLLGTKVEQRKVSDPKYLTIYTLMEKHRKSVESNS